MSQKRSISVFMNDSHCALSDGLALRLMLMAMPLALPCREQWPAAQLSTHSAQLMCRHDRLV
jgi:hypothetical protein